MKKFALSAFVIAAISGSAMAQETITSWINFQQPGDQAFSPVGTEAANVTGNVLTRGSGLNPNAGNNSLNSSGWDEIGGNDFLTFGFDVAPGFEVDLSTLWLGSRSSNSGPGSLGLFYSGDGFATNLFTITQSGTDFSNNIIDLSALPNLTGTVEFRISMLNFVSANGGSVSGSGTFRVGDHFDSGNFSEMRFEGTVIPTPGAIALFAAAGLAAARRRRA